MLVVDANMSLIYVFSVLPSKNKPRMLAERAYTVQFLGTTAKNENSVINLTKICNIILNVKKLLYH